MTAFALLRGNTRSGEEKLEKFPHSVAQTKRNQKSIFINVFCSKNKHLVELPEIQHIGSDINDCSSGLLAASSCWWWKANKKFFSHIKSCNKCLSENFPKDLHENFIVHMCVQKTLPSLFFLCSRIFFKLDRHKMLEAINENERDKF